MQKKKKNYSIGLIGYGSFGRLISVLLDSHKLPVDLKIYSRGCESDKRKFFDFDEVAASDYVVPAVPIRSFEEVLKKLSPKMKKGSILIDVCSIKAYPQNLMIKNLPRYVQKISTHPMFGPATYKKLGNSVEGLNIVVENVDAEGSLYISFKKVLEKVFKLNVVEMAALEHDRLAGNFHFLAQLVAHILKGMQIKRSPIDTKSASVMFDYLDMIGTDKDIIVDMYKYNPYCKDKFEEFEENYYIIEKLLKRSKLI